MTKTDDISKADCKNLSWKIHEEDSQPKLEPRILIEDPERSYHPQPIPSQGGEKKGGENILISGNNLLALKAMEQDFSGKVI